MKQTFKKDDRVKCIDDGGHKHLTTGDIYTIVDFVEGEAETRISVNSGIGRWYNTNRFELFTDSVKDMDLYESIEYAKTLVGKSYLYGGLRLIGSYVTVYLDDKQFKSGYGSLNAREDLGKYGFSVCINGTDNLECPIRDTEPLPESTTIKLTDDYDAVISKNSVKVGCQTIPKDKIVEIYNTIMAFK